MALVVLSSGSASALPPLDAVDDIGTPLNNVGVANFSVLANDIGQDGLAADCSGAASNNCQFDRYPRDPAGQQGGNGLLVITPETGEAEYTTTVDPVGDPEGYASLLASAPACSGVIDTFEYTLIGSLAGVVVEPASSDTATIAIAIGTAQRQVDAVDDAASTKAGVAVSGNLLVNDCDQTPKAGFAGTDTFTYTIVTTDDGAPRTASATVTVTVTAAPVAPPPPGLPATGTDNVVPIGLAGGALLLLGSSLAVFARRRRTEVG